MPLRKTKTETHEQKLAAVAATKEAALSVFAAAASDLHAAADQAEELHSDLDFQISRLRELQDAAAVESAESRSKAAQIRATFLGA